MTSTVSEVNPGQGPSGHELQSSSLENSKTPATRDGHAGLEEGEIGDGNGVEKTTGTSQWRRVYEVLTWTPPNCRWDPNRPPQFSMSMNVLFAFAAGCKLHLYYIHSSPLYGFSASREILSLTLSLLQSRSQTCTTTIQFSISSHMTSACGTRKLRRSPPSCKPGTRQVCCFCVRWGICCPEGRLCVDWCCSLQLCGMYPSRQPLQRR